MLLAMARLMDDSCLDVEETERVLCISQTTYLGDRNHIHSCLLPHTFHIRLFLHGSPQWVGMAGMARRGSAALLAWFYNLPAAWVPALR